MSSGLDAEARQRGKAGSQTCVSSGPVTRFETSRSTAARQTINSTTRFAEPAIEPSNSGPVQETRQEAKSATTTRPLSFSFGLCRAEQSMNEAAVGREEISSICAGAGTGGDELGSGETTRSQLGACRDEGEGRGKIRLGED
ncbi:unnamed protein product [Calypogeia fissa]